MSGVTGWRTFWLAFAHAVLSQAGFIGTALMVCPASDCGPTIALGFAPSIALAFLIGLLLPSGQLPPRTRWTLMWISGALVWMGAVGVFAAALVSRPAGPLRDSLMVLVPMIWVFYAMALAVAGYWCLTFGRYVRRRLRQRAGSRFIKRALGPLAVLAAALVLLARSLSMGGPVPKVLEPTAAVHERVIRLEGPGDIWDVEWITRRWIAVTHNPRPNTNPTEFAVWRVRPDGSRFEPLGLPDDPGCSRITRYTGATTLPGGKLGFVKECFGKPKGDRHEIVAYDMRTGVIETLTRDVGWGSGTFTYAPNLRLGVMTEWGGTCTTTTLAWLTSRGTEEFGVTVRAGEDAWGIDNSFLEQCTRNPWASTPAWSSDGEVIAFLLSPQAAGTSGPDREEMPADLYLMDVHTRRSVPHLTGTYLHSLTWSPDSRWIAFMGSVDGAGEGLWAYSPDTRKLVRLSEEEFESLSWDPGGQWLLVLRDPDPERWPPKKELVFLDIRPILDPV